MFVGLAILIVLIFLIKLVALGAHALGLNPPLFLIESWPLGVPSRFYSGLFVFFGLLVVIVFSAMIFEVPILSDFLFPEEAAQ